MSELDALFPGRQITAGGELLMVMPFRFGQIVAVTAKINALSGAARAAGILAVANDTLTLAADWPLRIAEVIANGGDGVLDLCALAVGKPRSWIDALQADDGLLLAKTVFEVNGDFFVKRIAPMLPGVIQQSGAPSSPASLSPATPSMPSAATP